MNNIFTPRAVSEEVWRARGYRRYGAHDLSSVRAVDPRLERDEPAWLRESLTAPGWVIPKVSPLPDHRLFGWTPYAQLRPDHPVRPRREFHNHEGLRHRPEGCICGVAHSGPPIRRIRMWGAQISRPDREIEYTWDWYQRPLRGLGRLEHERKLCEWAPVEAVPTWVKILNERQRDNSVEALVPTGHLHPDTGEVVVPLDRPHAHLDWAKYLYMKGEGRAKRFGTHPRMVNSNFAAPEGVIFWAIEGTLKLDAIVSAGWPGIETGSVTLWDSWEYDYDTDEDGPHRWTVDELDELAGRHLAGRRVPIVCDSDWADNDKVRRQLDAAVALLASHGVDAVGCAPPPGESRGWRYLNGEECFKKQGVDDYLFGFDLADRHDALLAMPVREEIVASAIDIEATNASQRPAGRETGRRLLYWAQNNANEAGEFSKRRHEIAEAIDRDPRRVDDAWERFLARGAFEPVEGGEGDRYYAGVGVGGRPQFRSTASVYRLREDLRRRAARTLRDWLA